MNIAFLGLGNMGFPIAKNLVARGHRVTTAIHKDPAKARRLEALGGHIAPSAAEAVKDAELIFSIVPNDAALLELLLAPEMAAAIAPGATLVEMTSSSPRAIQRVEEIYRPRQIVILDAPVSGGVAKAENGTMTMICAGKKEVYDASETILREIAGTICYVGETVGQAKIIKSLNNLLSAANKVAVSEAWKIAQANQVDPDAFFNAISVCSGDSNGLRAIFPRIQHEDYSPSFTVALMRKDLGLALDLAQGQSLPLAQTVLEYFRRASAFDGEDNTAVAKVRF